MRADPYQSAVGHDGPSAVVRRGSVQSLAHFRYGSVAGSGRVSLVWLGLRGSLRRGLALAGPPRGARKGRADSAGGLQRVLCASLLAVS